MAQSSRRSLREGVSLLGFGEGGWGMRCVARSRLQKEGASEGWSPAAKAAMAPNRFVAPPDGQRFPKRARVRTIQDRTRWVGGHVVHKVNDTRLDPTVPSRNVRIPNERAPNPRFRGRIVRKLNVIEGDYRVRCRIVRIPNERAGDRQVKCRSVRFGKTADRCSLAPELVKRRSRTAGVTRRAEAGRGRWLLAFCRPIRFRPRRALCRRPPSDA